MPKWTVNKVSEKGVCAFKFMHPLHSRSPCWWGKKNHATPVHRVVPASRLYNVMPHLYPPRVVCWFIWFFTGNVCYIIHNYYYIWFGCSDLEPLFHVGDTSCTCIMLVRPGQLVCRIASLDSNHCLQYHTEMVTCQHIHTIDRQP